MWTEYIPREISLKEIITVGVMWKCGVSRGFVEGIENTLKGSFWYIKHVRRKGEEGFELSDFRINEPPKVLNRLRNM